MSFNSKKNFRNIGGTSVVTPELLREDSEATDALNIDLYDNYGLSSRRGEESIEAVSAIDARGAFTTSLGEKLVFTTGPSPLRRVEEQTLNVDITDASTYTVEVYQDFRDTNNTKFMKIFQDGVQVYDTSLGNDIGSTPLSTLINAVNVNVPGVTLSVPDDSKAAHGLSIIRLDAKAVEPGAITHEFMVDIPGSGIGWSGSQINSAVERNGVVYFTTGSKLYKYDGTSYYPASLPKPLNVFDYSPSTGGAASSSPADGIYRYRVIFEYTDGAGNPIRSTPSDEFQIQTNGTNSPQISLPGGFLDPSIPGVTFTIIRTKEISGGGGSIFFVVGTGLAVGSTFTDNVSDASLTEDYPLPPFELNALTNAKYADIWRGLIVLTGIAGEPDKVLFEDIEYLEGFSESNSFLTESRQGGENSGIKSQDNAMFVFKENSITLVTGDLATGQFQVDKLTEEGIGAVSHASLIESGGRIWFMSREGIYSVGQDGLKPESPKLEPIFEKEYTIDQLRRCVAFNNVVENKLMFNLSNLRADNNNSNLNQNKTYTYNLKVQDWFIWDTMDFSGGMSIKGKDIWYLGNFSYSGTNIISYKRIARTFTNLDFSDRGIAIDCVHKAHWETLGEPSAPKKFVRIKLYSIDNERQRFESPEFTVEIETEHDYKYGVKVSGASLRFYQINADGSTTPVNSRRLRLLPKKARALRYIIRHKVLNENFLISGIEFEIAYEHETYQRQG